MKPQPEPSTQEALAGLVERVTFHNTENGFCVLRAKARGHRELVTVVGHAAIISAGEWITATGRVRTHAPERGGVVVRGGHQYKSPLRTPCGLRGAKREIASSDQAATLFDKLSFNFIRDIAPVIMNEGTEGRTNAFSGMLSKPAAVPVVGVAYERGRSLDLSSRTDGATTVRLAVDAVSVAGACARCGDVASTSHYADSGRAYDHRQRSPGDLTLDELRGALHVAASKALKRF
jgi:hypothetical protein